MKQREIKPEDLDDLKKKLWIQLGKKLAERSIDEHWKEVEQN